MSFDFRATLKRRIASENDPARRDVWMMQDAQTDYFQQVVRAGTDEVLAALNELRNDKPALREAVLNGLSDTHHDDHIRCREDHDKLHDHLEFSEANQELIDRAKPLMAFVEEQMREIEESRATRKTFAQKVLEGAAGQIGTIAATALVTWIGFNFLKG